MQLFIDRVCPEGYVIAHERCTRTPPERRHHPTRCSHSGGVRHEARVHSTSRRKADSRRVPLVPLRADQGREGSIGLYSGARREARNSTGFLRLTHRGHSDGDGRGSFEEGRLKARKRSAFSGQNASRGTHSQRRSVRGKGNPNSPMPHPAHAAPGFGYNHLASLIAPANNEDVAQ